MHKYMGWACGAAALALMGGISFAQTVPDAGALRQQIERDLPPLLPTEPPKGVATPPATPAASGAATVEVKAFRLLGNQLLTAEQLSGTLAAYTGRALTFAELQAAAAAVAQAYRDAGWVVRTLVPQQEVVDGVVTIQIVEAVFGRTVIGGTAAQRVKPATLLSYFEQQQRTGQPLKAHALDRALLLADDLPGVAVSGALQEGLQAGQTDLVLTLVDESFFIGEAGLDNTGSRATGPFRATVNAQLVSPLGWGDLLNAQLIHSRGTDYLRLGYSLPVGHNGLRLGVNASTLDYRIVTKEFQTLNTRGKSQSGGLDATYPLIRARQHNLYLQGAFDQRQFSNESNNTEQSDYRIRSWSMGLNGNSFDGWGGGGANSASLSVIQGRVNQGSLQPGENPVLAGSFSKWRIGLSRQQAWIKNVTLYASVIAQGSGDSLDSSEKFFLGGSSGVRAYPGNEGSGSAGHIATLEVRTRVADSLSLTTFYDHGAVRNRDGSPSYDLKGLGLGLAWSPSWGGQVRLTWARRVGNNPNPTATGLDQDGSLRKNRFWLTATVPF